MLLNLDVNFDDANFGHQCRRRAEITKIRRQHWPPKFAGRLELPSPSAIKIEEGTKFNHKNGQFQQQILGGIYWKEN
jgi:hypothetical protein